MPVRNLPLYAATIAVLFVVSTATAQFDPFPGAPGDDEPKTAEELVQIRALSDVKSIHPKQTFHIALIFDIEPHWHIYWKNPGETGAPTGVKVKAPIGLEVGEVKWTRPMVIKAPDGLTYGYENQTVLFVPVKTGAVIPPRKAEFMIEVNWLVCKEVCMFGRKLIPLRVESSMTEEPAEPSGNKTIQTYFDRIPKPLKKQRDASVTFDGSILTVSGPSGEYDTVEFLPVPVPGVIYGESEINVVDGTFTVQVPVELSPHNAMGGEMTIDGLVALGTKQKDPSYEFSIPARATSPVAPNPRPRHRNESR